MTAIWAALAMVGGAAAGQQAPAPATTTIQQAFEAATALDAGNDMAAALAAWQALEHRALSKRSRGVVLLRKSAALARMDRRDEAVAAARAGLVMLPTNDPTLREDRFVAYLSLGAIAQLSANYADAVDNYRQAETIAERPEEKLGALRGLIQTATFTDPAAATAAAARAAALMATVTVDDTLKADFASARAVLALNRQDYATAVIESKAAVKLLGGLTARTNSRDVAARSTAALALLLAGRKNDAREYMAMTGAGRLQSGKLDMGAAMTPPDCGGEAGLKPADIAVVQFTIADDGSVAVAEPIYAAGGGEVALAFARSVRQWSWTTEQVQQMPKFLRVNARVELRCNSTFPRPSVSDGLMADLIAWAMARGVPIADEPVNPAQALPGQRAALAAMAGSDTIATLPALVALIRSPVVPDDEKAGLARRALAIAQAAKAPVTGQLALDLIARTSTSADLWKRGALRQLIGPLITQAPYVDDPSSRAALRLLLADRERTDVPQSAEALLQQVADDVALTANDPLKVGALIRLASLAEQRGDTAAARTAFTRSGLSADQCALVDDPPTVIGYGPNTFPKEAMDWGFEGWTRTQFDVDAKGHAANVRVIVSYPPFIFTNAGAETMATARFSKSYRPDGGLACGAKSQNVRFGIPR